MPNQKTPKSFVEPQQVFDADRQAHFDAQKKQAEGMTDIASKNLALKMRAVKKKKKKKKKPLMKGRPRRIISNVSLVFDLDS